MSHHTEVKVRFYELDPYDHVNHTSYLGYFESARVEALDAIGFGMNVLKEAGFQIVVVELNARFLAPAGLHDVLEIGTEVAETARASSKWRQEMRRDGNLIATLEVRAAFTDLEGRPHRPPDGFVEAMLKL
ncbi:MAG TPA: acyl-CoA thioesterase [Acidimicrobiia bacterium]